MPKPLPARKRNAILADIKAGQKSCSQIARDHGVARSTVSRIAQDVPGAFERSQTEKATHAKTADCRARRVQLQSDLLDDAQRFRKRAWSPYPVVVATPDGAEVITLDLPPLQDARAAYTAIGIAVDKDLAIERASTDNSSGLAAVDTWLRGMLSEAR